MLTNENVCVYTYAHVGYDISMHVLEITVTNTSQVAVICDARCGVFSFYYTEADTWMNDALLAC